MTFLRLGGLLALIFLLNSNTYSQLPEWAKGIVWYQIFPERFANGDTTNDPSPARVFVNEKNIDTAGWRITPWTSDWFALSEWEKKTGKKFRDVLLHRRYGGDLAGIIRSLDYLKKLGVGAIYLNPIFDAVSLHKYDGSTFHHVDVHFGPDPKGDLEIIRSEVPDDPSTWKFTSADLMFLELIRQVHARNMHIIIDGVFNHTGVQFWAFQDIVKNGAASKYADWFQIKKFDDPKTPENEFDYKGWWNYKGLPEFNRTKDDLQPEVKKYIFAATKRWLDPDGNPATRDGIDGWRLDVARDVPVNFWVQWKKHVKSVNPNAITIGELWELSPDFVSSDGAFDALMNYNFAFAVKDLFMADRKRISVSEFIKQLQEIDKNYPEENLHVLQNLLNSHDTERLSSMIYNPDRGYDRDGDERNSDFNPGKPPSWVKARQKLITAFQMTYRGAPMVYYGDEAGMWGADDPHDRKPMLWGNYTYDYEDIDSKSGFSSGRGVYKVEFDLDLHDFYKTIINIRNASPALTKGDVRFIYTDDKNRSFGFERRYEDDLYIIFFNLSPNTEMMEYSVPSNYIMDVYHNERVQLEEGKLRFVLWGESFSIYKIIPETR